LVYKTSVIVDHYRHCVGAMAWIGNLAFRTTAE
jgi:hypothetical protein